jgi:AcrR family transcriptional regulator
MAKAAKAKRAGRLGRPPKDLAGDVAGRILNAAEQVFLERGFQSASIDEIAARAPASKPTIYGHFAGKEALFAAVVARIIDGLTKLERYTPEGRTVQDKLTSLGIEMVERTVAESVGVFRATIAEAQRFPNLSRRVHEAARNQGADAVSHLLNNATQTLSRAPSDLLGGKRRIATAQIFMDLILLPMLMRSLMGDEAKILRKELPSFMRERVGFFLAACEAGWKL